MEKSIIKARGKNDLAAIMLTSIFMNGFETGGYQAALLYIAHTYYMSIGTQGVMASIELFATMIAPVIFGRLADKVGKKKVLMLFTLCRAVSGMVIIVAASKILFAIGIFGLGFATSIIQCVAIAGIDDAYPRTAHKKMGITTAMYAFGALTAPLIVGIVIKAVGSWKAFFAVDVIISLLLILSMLITSFAPREERKDIFEARGEVNAAKINVYGVVLLCIIMLIYVGVENGVGFFLNGFFRDCIGSERGYLALSIFWFAMIPSRILCGFLTSHRKIMLTVAPAGAAVMLVALAGVTIEFPAFLTVFILGIFCGAVYPNVLTYAADFSGMWTATVIAAITVATGVGGTLATAAFGFLTEAFGYKGGFIILAMIIAIDVIFAVLVVKKKSKTGDQLYERMH